MPKDELDERLNKALLDKRRELMAEVHEIDAVLTRQGVETGTAVLTRTPKRKPPAPKTARLHSKSRDHLAAIRRVLERAEGPLKPDEVRERSGLGLGVERHRDLLKHLEQTGVARSWRTAEGGHPMRYALVSKLTAADANGKEVLSASA